MAPLLYSQENTGAQDAAGKTATVSGTITDIEITGLKRTKPYIARYPLEKFLGREGSTLDMNEVQAAVRDTGILEPLSIELVDNGEGVTLHVTVQEKWSIFPFPVFMANSAYYSFGLFFSDMNAFGLRDQAAVGGTYGNTGWSAMLFYQHNPNHAGIPGWNTSFMYARQQNVDTDRNEVIFRRFTTDQVRYSLGLNYPLSGIMSLSGTVSFTDISIIQNDNAINPPGDGAMFTGFSPGFSLRASNWDGFFLSQRSLSLAYGYNLAISGSSYHRADFRGVFEQPIVPGFRLSLRSGAVWKSDVDRSRAPLIEDAPQRAAVDILPMNFSARQYAGFSAGFEKCLFVIRWGTLSAIASWQCVFSDGPISGYEFDNGPSAGVRFYLSRLALPAMGVGIAYNMNSGLYQFGFNLGMSF